MSSNDEKLVSENLKSYCADKAICRFDDELDYFRFKPLAKTLADNITQLPKKDCYVLAVNGEWGSGKSSLLYYVTQYLSERPAENKLIVINYDPWMFSGRTDLVMELFLNLHAELKLREGIDSHTFKIFEEFFSYLETVLQLAAPIITPVPSILAGGARIGIIFAKKKYANPVENAKNLAKTRNALIKNLETLDEKLVIIIDNIDRLTGSEIRSLFQAIKAVSDFPNIVYVLAYDQKIVESALDYEFNQLPSQVSSHIISGREYLKKIVQFTVPVPDTTPLLKNYAEKLLLSLNSETIDLVREKNPQLNKRWNAIYQYGLSHLLKHPRDVIRSHNTLLLIKSAINDEIDFLDLICLEMIREYEPKLYDHIRMNPQFFVGSAYNRITDPLMEIYLAKIERVQQELEYKNKFHAKWLADYSDKPYIKYLVAVLFPDICSALSSDEKELKQMLSNTTCKKTEKSICSGIWVFMQYFHCMMESTEIDSALDNLINDFWDLDTFENKILEYNVDPNQPAAADFFLMISKIVDSPASIPSSSLQKIVNCILRIDTDLCAEHYVTTSVMGPKVQSIFDSALTILTSVARERNKDGSFSFLKEGFEQGTNILLMSACINFIQLSIQKGEECRFKPDDSNLKELGEIFQKKFDELVVSNPKKLLLPQFTYVKCASDFYPNIANSLKRIITQIWIDPDLLIYFICESRSRKYVTRSDVGIMLLYYISKDDALKKIQYIFRVKTLTEEVQQLLLEYLKDMDDWPDYKIVKKLDEVDVDSAMDFPEQI